MIKGHLTLIRCDEVAEPTAQPKAYEPKAFEYKAYRVSVGPFTSTIGLKTPRRITTSITVCGGGPTATAELDRKGLTELRDHLTNMLDGYDNSGWEE